MLLLILDHVRRWWWVLALVFLLAAASAFAGSPFFLAPAGVILLLFDTYSGLIRTTASLPVSREAQARARWFFAVPLVVVCGGLAMLAGGIFRILVAPPASGGLGVVLQTWMGFGYAGLAFIGASLSGRRAPETGRDYATQMVGGLCLGVALTAPMWLTPHLPRYIGDLRQWHWNLLTAVGLFVGISYLCSEELIRRGSKAPGRQTSSRTVRQGDASSGARGIRLYLLSVPARVMLFTSVMTLVQGTTIQLLSSKWTSSIESLLAFQFALFAVFISTFVTEQANLRALRALPLSSRALTLLLLSGPCLSAAGLMIFLIPKMMNEGLSVEAFVKIAGTIVGVAGGGALFLALVLRYIGAARLCIIFGVAVLAPFAILFLPEIPGAAPAFGVIAGIVGYLLLHHSLRYSSATYQPRRLLGMAFGQSQ